MPGSPTFGGRATPQPQPRISRSLPGTPQAQRKGTQGANDPFRSLTSSPRVQRKETVQPLTQDTQDLLQPILKLAQTLSVDTKNLKAKGEELISQISNLSQHIEPNSSQWKLVGQQLQRLNNPTPAAGTAFAMPFGDASTTKQLLATAIANLASNSEAYDISSASAATKDFQEGWSQLPASSGKRLAPLPPTVVSVPGPPPPQRADSTGQIKTTKKAPAPPKNIPTGPSPKVPPRSTNAQANS